jgi:capsid protein
MSRLDTLDGGRETRRAVAIGGFAYDATEPKNRRAAPSGNLYSEDRELATARRRTLVSGARDLRRNFAIAAWAIRKHLDYVSSFRFRADTGNPGLDDQIDRLVEIAARPQNFDAAGRHGLRRFIRLMEACRVVDGDILAIKLADGTLQAIEGDRIREPQGGSREFMPPPGAFINGVKVDDAGRPLAYAVHRRGPNGNGFEFERTIAASKVIYHAWLDRFDQIRGISPLAAAMNTYRDVYESFDYALAKAKVAQMFGLVFYRDAVDPAGDVTASSDSSSRYDVDFGRGPVLLDLDPGDKAEFLENKTPPTEFQSFCTTMISVALKSLDLPFSFYDEAHANFHSTRGAFNLYLKSARAKQEDVRAVLDQWTLWRLQLAIVNGEVTLPAGMTIGNVRWQWMPDGVQWWDAETEIKADAMAISGGFDNWERVTRERMNGDVYDNIDANARVLEYAKSKGVQLVLPAQGVAPLTTDMSGGNTGNGGGNA